MRWEKDWRAVRVDELTRDGWADRLMDPELRQLATTTAEVAFIRSGDSLVISFNDGQQIMDCRIRRHWAAWNDVVLGRGEDNE